MAKETQKDKIERLENEIKQKDEKIKELQMTAEKLSKNITELLSKANEEFENSGDRKQLLDKIFLLEKKLEIKEKDIQKLESVQKLKNEIPHNERGAGRKPKVANQDKGLIREKAAAGSSIRQLAKEFNISVGTVHKIISEQR